MLNAEKIKEYMSEKADVFIYDVTDSTNTQAKNMLRDSLSGNAVFVADSQNGGRGRQGKQFYSPKSTGLYMSVALWGGDTLDSLFVTTAAAVLVTQAIEELCNISVSIKWVNDLYINGKKICGILTEAVRDYKGNLIGIVVGVGVNITTISFPEEIKDVAASLGVNTNRNRLTALIADKIIKGNFDNESILAEYKKRSMVMGKDIIYYINNIPHYGKAVDIDDNGGLIVESAGELVVLNSGEITLRIDKKSK